MSSMNFAMLPSLRRQNLLAEFAGLKQSCPQGVFVSLTPGDPLLWSGVIFVRKGPYETAILRFYISFPDTYPALPPLVTFSTDIFHPLITPLTTYMYTTDIQEGGTVSATDEERLPPGGFSLRHGFPAWFGRGSRSRQASGQRTPLQTNKPRTQTPPRSARAGGPLSSTSSTPNSKIAATPSDAGVGGAQRASFTDTSRSREEVSTFEVLRYIRSAFDEEDVLDTVPLEAAGNPGAWHAWRTHRGGSEAEAQAQRKPGEWNWEGVWEERVKKGITASQSEPVLFGSVGGDDTIRFLSMEDGEVDKIKDNLYRTLGVPTRADPMVAPSASA